jgi:hypothetical protein
MREYFQNLYPNNLENLGEMNNFYAFHLPKFNREDINYLNRSITSRETEAVIVSQQRKAQDTMESL